MDHATTYVVFLGERRLADGPATTILPALRALTKTDTAALPLVFEEHSGRQVELDSQGDDDVSGPSTHLERPGPGRPKLGVVSREVSLLPRQWDWLQRQGPGASGVLRRLVDQARASPTWQATERRQALGRILTAVAGNLPSFEEVLRALERADDDRLRRLIGDWPSDVRAYALERAARASALAASATKAPPEARPDGSAGAAVAVVEAVHDRIWSRGDLSAIPDLVAPEYRVHSDPGDPWEGKTLDHPAYGERVQHSRRAFPDLRFTIEAAFGDGSRVAVRWHAMGTHQGDLPGLLASGRSVRFAGQTEYALDQGRVAGHWQVVDRLGFIEQLRG